MGSPLGQAPPTLLNVGRPPLGGHGGKRAFMLCICNPREEIKTTRGFKAYAGVMTHIPERLTRLRQEITDLRNMNAIYSQRRAHSPLEKSAAEGRGGPVFAIKQEI